MYGYWLYHIYLSIQCLDIFIIPQHRQWTRYHEKYSLWVSNWCLFSCCILNSTKFPSDMHTFPKGRSSLNESFNKEKEEEEKIHSLKKVVTENRSSDWDSNYTLAWLKVWKEAAKGHTQRENSQQKKWERWNTNVQRIGWNRLWNWVWTEKRPEMVRNIVKQLSPKLQADGSGTAMQKSERQIITEINGNAVNSVTTRQTAVCSLHTR